MIRRYLAWSDRNNPLRGKSPLAIYFQTLLTFAILLGLLALVDADTPLLVGSLVGYSIGWFEWVWRA